MELVNRNICALIDFSGIAEVRGLGGLGSGWQ